MAVVGETYVAVRGKTDGFERDVVTAGNNAGRNLARSLLGAAAVVKGVQFFKGAITEANDAQKVFAQTQAVIKSTGGAAKVTAKDVDNLATAISNKTAVDDDAIAAGENLLLTFTNVRNEVGVGRDIFNQATETLVDMAAAMGTDVSAGAIQLGKALNDPTKGITALTRVGVTFTEQQQKQIEAMQKAGDTAGAQRVILAELQKEFGGSAAAQATATDRIATAFGNLKEAIGTALLPVIADLSDKLVPLFQTFTDMDPATQKLVGEFALGGAGILGLAFAVDKLSGSFDGLKKSVLFLVDNPLVLTLLAVGAAFAYAYKKSEAFRDIVQLGLVGAFLLVGQVADVAMAAFRRVVDFLRVVFAPQIAVVTAVFDHLGDAVRTAVRTVLRILGDMADIVGSKWKILLDVLTGRWAEAWDEIKSLPGKVLRLMVDSVKTAFDWAHLLFDIGQDIVRGLWDGIKDMGGWLKDKVGGFISDHVPGPVKKLLGIGSPSKLFADIGRDVVLGLIQGITENTDHTAEAMKGLRDRLVQGAGEMMDALTQAVAAKQAGLQDAILGGFDITGLSTSNDLFQDVPVFTRDASGNIVPPHREKVGTSTSSLTGFGLATTLEDQNRQLRQLGDELATLTKAGVSQGLVELAATDFRLRQSLLDAVNTGFVNRINQAFSARDTLSHRAGGEALGPEFDFLNKAGAASKQFILSIAKVENLDVTRVVDFFNQLQAMAR